MSKVERILCWLLGHDLDQIDVYEKMGICRVCHQIIPVQPKRLIDKEAEIAQRAIDDMNRKTQ